MNIKSQLGNAIRPDAASSAPVAKPEKAAVIAPVTQSVPRQSDAVQISDAGRALAARDGKASSLTPERTAQIRQRVLDGAYNSLAVIDQVASRILDSGDL